MWLAFDVIEVGIVVVLLLSAYLLRHISLITAFMFLCKNK